MRPHLPPGAETDDIDLLMFVVRFHAKHGYGPTHADIRSFMGWESNGSTVPALARLREKGWITWDRKVPRSLRPLLREVSRTAAT